MTKPNRVTKLAVCLAIFATSIVAVPTSATAAKAQAKPTASKSSATKVAPARSTPKKKAYSPTTARARRTQLARARAAAHARELRDVQTPRFRVDEFGREVPDVRAEAAIIYNPTTGEVLWEDHAQD